MPFHREHDSRNLTWFMNADCQTRFRYAVSNQVCWEFYSVYRFNDVYCITFLIATWHAFLLLIITINTLATYDKWLQLLLLLLLQSQLMTDVLLPTLVSNDYAPQRAGNESLPGPTAPLVTEHLQLWNSLLPHLRDPDLPYSQFRQ